MITRPGRQAPIVGIPLKSGTEVNFRYNYLSHLICMANKSDPDQ
jgi:hypothetical protein